MGWVLSYTHPFSATWAWCSDKKYNQGSPAGSLSNPLVVKAFTYIPRDSNPFLANINALNIDKIKLCSCKIETASIRPLYHNLPFLRVELLNILWIQFKKTKLDYCTYQLHRKCRTLKFMWRYCQFSESKRVQELVCTLIGSFIGVSSP